MSKNEIYIDDVNDKFSIEGSFIFEPVTTQKNGTVIYRTLSKLFFTDEEEQFESEIIFNLYWKNIEQKDIVRIKNIKFINFNKHNNEQTVYEKDKSLNITRLWKINPYLNSLLFNMNIFFKKKISDNTQNNSNNSLEYSYAEMKFIENKQNGKDLIISKKFIDLISESSENDFNYIFTKSALSNLKKLKLELKNALYEDIKIDELKKQINKSDEGEKIKEGIFQKIFEDNKKILYLLFNLDSNFKICSQTKLKEYVENRADFLSNDFIIELKKPSTKLFTTGSNTARNGIAGISTEFASATNQLTFYIEKRNREIGLTNHQLANGALIIGSNKQFVDERGIHYDNRHIAWKYFKNNFKFEILTYDDVILKIERLIETLANYGHGDYETSRITEKNAYFNEIN